MNKTNLGYLITTMDNNREMVLELIDIFIEQVTEFGNEFEDLYKNKNFDGLGKLAHKAKSSVAIIGMDNLSRKLKELEQLAGNEENPEEYPAYINYFRQECAEAIKELNDYKNNVHQ
jgi:HPt (histidine-containing phosphotransfer) domain-containing protein